MEKSLWFATAHIHSSEQLNQFVALASFVQTYEEFEQRAQAYFAKNNIQYRFQLAPIPANLFFQRHGQTWLLHQASALIDDEIRIIPLSDKALQPVIEENVEYLNCHIINHIKPLDMQLDRFPALFAPEAISALLWPDFPLPPNLLDFEHQNNPIQLHFQAPKIDEMLKQRHIEQYKKDTSPTLKVYFVLDANKMPFFRSLHLNAKVKSLFQGKFGDDTEKVAPYLIEVIRDETHIHTGEMMGLFSLKSALHNFNWEDNLGIFIHSYADFDTLYQHLRKFPMIQDERKKWLFFRFYDPKVLRNYLAIISKHPAKLHKFFGYENNIIYAFGSGFGDNFYYYTLKALPQDTLPAPIVMTDWELEGFKKQKWQETKEDYLDEIWQNYNHNFTKEDKTTLLNCLDHAVTKGYESQKGIIFYALSLFLAKQKQMDFNQLKSSFVQQGHNQDEIATLLYNKLKQNT